MYSNEESERFGFQLREELAANCLKEQAEVSMLYRCVCGISGKLDLYKWNGIDFFKLQHQRCLCFDLLGNKK